jgi:hypothetical protein
MKYVSVSFSVISVADPDPHSIGSPDPDGLERAKKKEKTQPTDRYGNT